MHGYTDGPTLTHDEAPWPVGWEQDPRIDDGHAHQWERCTLLAGPQRHADDIVIRCAICHVPRCGHSTDDDPCMERRHHTGLHIHLFGSWAPLGGLPESFIDWTNT
jgi:hypothetical protein